MQKLLSPFGLFYSGIMKLRNRAFDQGWRNIYAAPIPIISVGNLSLGGTGKTPMAEYLIRLLLSSGQKAAYLSRGYGRKTKGYRLVKPQSDSAELVGDEALQLALKFPDVPVAVCENRARGIKQLLANSAIDLILLDDAFQHRKVARDLDIVMIDAKRLPIHDRVLPAGRLREGLQGLKRADLLVLNRVDQPAEIPIIKRQLSHFAKPMAFCHPSMQTIHRFGEGGQTYPVNWLRGKKVVAFSGIGNHAYFVDQIRRSGAIIVAEKSFRDHHLYKRREMIALEELCPSEGILISTEKDYCRLKSFAPGPKWHYVPIVLDWWSGEEEIMQKVQSLWT